MKILMLTPYLPYPLMSGGQTRSYNLIKNLSKKHDITLFSLIKDNEEKQYIPELQKFCKRVAVFKRSKTPWTLRNILLTGFGKYPFLVIRNLSPKERDAVESELKREEYDIIHAETFYVTPHIPKTDVPVLLVEQTVEYLVYKHYVQKQAWFFLRPILWIDLLKLKYWETYFWRHAEGVVAMSESDREVMQKLSPGLPIDIVPNGIDVSYFSKTKRKTSKEKRIVYVGSFSWLQNVEAAKILARVVWPKIKAELPDAKLWIVGKNVTPEIAELADSDIEVTESIPDIRDAYGGADVLVAPIKGPGGTRLKILEAMASGLPVVTSSVGAEGLGAKNGENIVIENDFKKMGEKAVSLLRNPKKAREIAKNAKALVDQNFSWEKMGKYLDEVYKSTATK